MDYNKYTLTVNPKEQEWIIGHLGVLPFEAFEERTGEIDAYLSSAENHVLIDKALKDLQSRYQFDIHREVVKNQNWNALWESNFHPIHIGNFCCVRAPFHPPDTSVRYEILIEPKMAFGTGHHETTYMMIQLMENLKYKEKIVLDYGCGTGILGILSSLMGALSVDAVDIDEWAVENSLENAERNNCTNLHIEKGTIDLVAGRSYDIILANINRNVILQTLSIMASLLKTGGQLLISGFLNSDRTQIVGEAEKTGLQITNMLTKGEWCAMILAHQHSN